MFSDETITELIRIFKARFDRDISTEEAQHIGLRIAQFVYVKAAQRQSDTQKAIKPGNNRNKKPDMLK